MAPRDAIPDDGIRVELPLDRARDYRASSAPETLRIACPWGPNDWAAALPPFLVVIAVVAGAAVAAYLTIPGSMWVSVAVVGMTLLGLLYAAAALLLNRTVVAMGSDGLTCAYRPLPWPGALVLRLEDVVAVVVEKRAPEPGGLSFDVVATTREGSATLIRRLPDVTSALRVAEALARHLRAFTPADVADLRPSGAPEVRASAARRFARVAGPRAT